MRSPGLYNPSLSEVPQGLVQEQRSRGAEKQSEEKKGVGTGETSNMVRLLISSSSGVWQALPMEMGLFVAVVALVALCAKHARRVSRKLVPRASESGCSRIAPKSPLTSPKLLFTTLSNKAIPFLQKKKSGRGGELEPDDGFGDGGLWQRDILMGEKCQPLDFSGVIFYDNEGKQVPEFPPRSPLTTPLQSSFSFPVVVTDKAGS